MSSWFCLWSSFNPLFDVDLLRRQAPLYWTTVFGMRPLCVRAVDRTLPLALVGKVLRARSMRDTDRPIGWSQQQRLIRLTQPQPQRVIQLPDSGSILWDDWYRRPFAEISLRRCDVALWFFLIVRPSFRPSTETAVELNQIASYDTSTWNELWPVISPSSLFAF